jgi:hypothetical protein
MRSLLAATWLALFPLPLFAQGAPPQIAADQPYTMEYYYKVQWGHQQEFLQLFVKNHYPVLKRGVESGRMVSVKLETPANHMTEDARWDYRVTIRFKTPPWRPPPILRKRPGSRSSGLIRRPSNAKNSGASKSCWRTGIFR